MIITQDLTQFWKGALHANQTCHPDDYPILADMEASRSQASDTELAMNYLAETNQTPFELSLPPCPYNGDLQ